MELTADNIKWQKGSEVSVGRTRGILIRFEFDVCVTVHHI